MTAAGAASLEARLRDLLAAEALTGDAAARAVDGSKPSLVAAPASQAEVAAVLGAADAAGAAVIPWGGGAQMGLGMPPLRYDLALDLRRLDAVVEYEPADLTVTVEAGARLSDLQARLGERGQWLPLDPPAAVGATVGGILATNASGPGRVAYGTARDLCIGMTVALAAGSLVKSGGRVVKNVAGYDLGKLHIGALGTLGVIVQASFKVAPLPGRSEHVTIDSAITDLMSITRNLSGLAVNAFVLTNERADGGWRLALRFAGSSAAVQRSMREVEALAAAASLSLIRVAGQGDEARGAAADEVVVRAGVLPGAEARVIDALAERKAAVVAYPTTGIAYGRWSAIASPSAETLASLRRLCGAAGGALVLESAPVELKRRVDVWGPPRADFALMRRLKAEFDAKGTLNPGRYAGGL